MTTPIVLAMPCGGTVQDIVHERAGEAIGISVLASALRAAGFEAYVLSNRRANEIEQAVRRCRPAMLGLSVTWANLRDCLAITRTVKTEFQDIRVVLGGPGVTFNSTAVLQASSAVDVIALGEGQETIVELAQAGNWPEDLTGIKGIAYRSPSGIVTTERRCGISNLSRLPLPDRREFAYLSRHRGVRTARVLASWGCPRACSFCLNDEWLKTCRPPRVRRRLMRKPAEVVREIEALYGLGARMIIFADEDAIGDTPREVANLSRIVHLLRDSNLDGLRFSILTSVAGVHGNPGLMSRFRDAGLSRVFLGVENLADGALVQLRTSAKTQLDALLETYGLLGGLGIFCMMGFIMFNPFGTKEDIETNLRILAQHPLNIAPFASILFRKVELYPGTALFMQFQRASRTRPRLWYNNPIEYGMLDPFIETAATVLDKAWRHVRGEEALLWEREARFAARSSSDKELRRYENLKSGLAALNIEMVYQSLALPPNSSRAREELLRQYLDRRTRLWESYEADPGCSPEPIREPLHA